ncbi:condensin complex subunit 1 [Sitophilus oryzae]|uniref:Condensin complex subunit 1 n=1 Tax=Sitophilus oryzae TaxID=7048 RepID=A0A6J2XVN2_SITOR|nr:condensin complex subunit 1 [Sitophilus oryzae]
MAYFTFQIPTKKEELLTEVNHFCVKNIVQQRNFLESLKAAKESLREEGAEFIIDNFDLFYSVIHHGKSLPMDLAFKAYQDLHKGVSELDKAIGFLLEDKSNINGELLLKYQNIMKMLIYIYTETALFIENTNLTNLKNENLLKKRKVADQSLFNIDKNKMLLVLNDLIQREIGLFWEPPIVEQNFLSLIAEVCYGFLANPCVKNDKSVRENIFNIIGTLIKSYNYGTVFTIRAIQMIKTEEHLVLCFNDGVKQLVEKFNCKGLIHSLVKECTEWQTDEKFHDSHGSRYCAQFLTAMAVQIPSLMLPEVLYINKYLDHDSYTLRNAVINVIAEVIINVLTKHTLTEEETEFRNDFLTILMDHIDDISAHVRSKVIQHWSRLQKENAIPRKLVNDVIEKIINHLEDKSALVRKSAANAITTFVATNIYSSDLSLEKMQAGLDEHVKMLEAMKTQFRIPHLDDLEAEWDSMALDLKKAIEEELKNEDEESDEEEEENEKNNQEIAEIIRKHLNEKKYKEAFNLARSSGIVNEEFEKFRKENKADEADLYMLLMKTLFVNPLKLLEDLKQGVYSGTVQATEEDVKKLESLQETIDYFTNAIAFLKLLDDALKIMVELLETTFISDMHEAVEFFTTAFQFNMANVDIGIMAMLKMMKRNEQDRKDVIVQAFKTIYLETDGNDMREHCSTVVQRLIRFLKDTPSKNFDDLELIIKEWVKKGILDNSIIDMLWQYFTQKCSISDEESHASVEILRMASLGRATIITKNIKLVANIGFGERGSKNMAFLGSCCELLAVAGRNRIDINSKDPPLKINIKDEIFKNLLDILVQNFFQPVEFYYKALSGAISFVYRVCGKPDKFCDDLIGAVLVGLKKLKEKSTPFQVPRYVYIRLCQLLGLVAVKQLDYLDDTVYRELKRRKQVKDDKNETSKKNKSVNASASTACNNTTAVEDSELEGAQVEDSEAEFILSVLEKETVCGTGVLGKLGHFIRGVCQRPDVYQDAMLQGAAVIALIRYMLVSSQFCQNNVQLLFTILERTTYIDVKESILIHLSDLLTRFPNIIEPWTPHIYRRLKDPSINIRKATFFTLSGLILRDMIRANSYISQMVGCLVDEDTELSSMCRTFFVTLAQKENNLYTMLPDIFSHLVNLKEIKDEDVKEIMKFLFNQISKTKQMENLVDRFCAKFAITEEAQTHRNIAFCLTLIVYNDKALRKLIDNFSSYKHLVHDSEIYASFKAIMQSCNKQQVGKTDLKPLVTELEQNISSVFELDADGNGMKPPQPPKSTKKTKRGRRKRKQSYDDADEEGDFAEQDDIISTPVRRTPRSKK